MYVHPCVASWREARELEVALIISFSPPTSVQLCFFFVLFVNYINFTFISLVHNNFTNAIISIIIVRVTDKVPSLYIIL